MGTLTQVVTAAAAFLVVAAIGRFAPRALRSASPLVVGLATVAAVGGALAADAAATGAGAYDAVLRALTGVAFVVTGCYATARPRLLAASLLSAASLLGAGDAWVATLGLGASLALVVLEVDGSAVGAVIGLTLGQAALRLDWPQVSGGTLAIGIAAFAVLAWSALDHVHRRTRRAVLVGGGILAAIVVVLGGLWGAAAATVRADLNAAVASAEAGLEASREGDTATAAAHFEDARSRFERASGRLDAWWAQPIRAVPIAAQNARALRVMTAAGADLSEAGTTTARSADPETIRPRNGVVPLAEIRALAAPLGHAQGALADARADLADLDSPWLVGMLAEKLETLDDKVRRGARDAETAHLAVEVVPRLLGGDGERRYFVAFQTPAELRASGGLIGNFAEVAYSNGAVDLVRNARNDDYNRGNPGTARTLTAPEDYIRRYGAYHPEQLIQNVTLSPDFPSVAQVLEGVYPQSGGSPVDGVISLDPIALAELLRLTGNVVVPGFGVELTPDNAADVLLHQQYLRYPDNEVRVEFLKAAVRAVFDRLESTELPGPARIGEVLGPMLREGRLQIHATREDEQAFLRRIGADGALPEVRGDFLGVVTQNAGGSKIDVFQHRRVRYAARVDPASGAIDATATVTVRNDAPAGGLPDSVIGSFPDNPLPLGTSRVMLSVYSPHTLVSASIDGTEAAAVSDRELGRNVYTVQIDVPPGAERVLEVALRGRVGLGAQGDRYRLGLWHQATVNPDRVRIEVRATPGWSVEPGRGLRPAPFGASGSLTLRERSAFVARFHER